MDVGIERIEMLLRKTTINRVLLEPSEYVNMPKCLLDILIFHEVKPVALRVSSITYLQVSLMKGHFEKERSVYQK